MPDEQFVREWLDLAARGVGLGGSTEFADRVIARLRKGGRSYGDDNYLTAPLEELEREGAEEPDDTAGWAVLIAARLYHELRHERMDPASAQLKQGHLLRAAGYGLLAWYEYEAAREA